MADYVKADDLGFIAQLKSFAEKIPSYQTQLGLTAAQLTSAADDAEFMAFVVLGNNSTAEYRQGWTNLKNNARAGSGTTPLDSFPVAVDVSSPPTAVPAGIEKRFRSLAGQIKAHPNYTDAMGEDLGIVAPEDTTAIGAPALKIILDGGSPVISFKKGKSDGIKIYCKRGTETEFSFLAVDTRSPYTDNRPNQTAGTTETRQYYAYYIKADAQVGKQSTVAEISVP